MESGNWKKQLSNQFIGISLWNCLTIVLYYNNLFASNAFCILLCVQISWIDMTAYKPLKCYLPLMKHITMWVFTSENNSLLSSFTGTMCLECVFQRVFQFKAVFELKIKSSTKTLFAKVKQKHTKINNRKFKAVLTFLGSECLWIKHFIVTFKLS